MNDYNSASSILGGAPHDYYSEMTRSAAVQKAASQLNDARQPEFMAIVSKLDGLIERACEVGGRTSDNMDRILGPSPENNMKQGEPTTGSSGSVGEVRTLLNRLSDALHVIEVQTQRLNAL
jgi:hypothetical protein